MILSQFITKAQSALNLLLDELKPEPELKKFITHNHKTWKSWKISSPEKEIIIDFFPLFGSLIGRDYACNILAKKYNAKIVAYSSKPFIKPKLKALYKSFNTEIFMRLRFSKEIRAEAERVFHENWPKIKSKQDLMDFELRGCNIGMDIYETYLRQFHQPTAHLHDPNLKKVFLRGVCIQLFWEEYFKKKPVAAVITSHPCYIEFNVITRVAANFKIPVYLVRAEGIHQLGMSDGWYNDFHKYADYFSKLPIEEQKRATAWSKERLALRFKGVVGVDMPYSTKSAFGEKSDQRIMAKSDKVKILVCSHCFFDNPHCYGKLIFPDFYEWLVFLRDLAKQTDYDWYIKVHPNFLPATVETIEEIMGENSPMKIIPPSSSHKQLVAEGLDYAITAYGTIGFEYPLLGVQVISLGYNPRTSFHSVNFQPKTIEEYRNLILSLSSRPKVNLVEEEIYKGYFMFFDFIWSDDLIFPSHKQFLRDLPGLQNLTEMAFKYFLENLDEARHEKIISRLTKYFDSNSPHLYLLEKLGV